MYVITVDVAKCQGCADCVDTCPNELIAMVERRWQAVRHVQGRSRRLHRLLLMRVGL